MTTSSSGSNYPAVVVPSPPTSPAPAPKKSLQDLVLELPGRIFRREALAIILLLVVGGVGSLWAQTRVDARLEAKVDAGVAPVAHDLAEHIEATAQVHQAQSHAIEKLERQVEGTNARLDAFMDAWARREGVPTPRPRLADGGGP